MKTWSVKQPLLPVVLLFTAGILLANFVQLPLAGVMELSLAVAALAVCWPRERSVLLAALAFLAGVADFTCHTAVIAPDDLRTLIGGRTELLTVRGKLCETPVLRLYETRGQTIERARTEMEITAVQPPNQPWQPAFGRVSATAPGDVARQMFAGQTAEVTGVLQPPRVPVAEGLFDYREYLQRQEIYFQLQTRSTDDWYAVSTPSRPPLADRFRAWGCRALALGLPGEDESLRLEWALTLGWKTALTDGVSEPFIRASTYHIFAVDGLRLAIIFGIFFALLRALNIPRPACGLFLVPFIWFYTALTGWPASAIRATVMLTIVILGWTLKRPVDLLNSLFAAALVILLWQPQQLFQAGFQLSFFVVLSILLVLPPLDDFVQRLLKTDPFLPAELLPRWRKILQTPLRYVVDVFLVSFAAWLGSVPLAAHYFNIFTPVSAPANLVAVPLCALVLTANIISLLLAGWFRTGAVVFNQAGWFLMECIRVTSTWFSHWPGAYFYVAAPGWLVIGAYYFVLLALMTGWIFKPAWRAVKISVLVLLVAAWGWHFWREHSVTRLTVLPLDGGSAIFCDGPGSKDDLLINCGAEMPAESVVTPFLRAQGRGHLHRLLLTHGDVRLVGGAETIMQNFSVDQIIASPLRFRSPTYRQILDGIKNKLKISRGDSLGVWTVLHPGADDSFPRADDGALVLRGSFSGVRVLLLSDLGRAGQDALLARNPDVRADIVVAGLPEDDEPLCDALLDAIHPRVIVIADSELPATRRAGQALQERLARRGVPVIYARDAGAVTVSLRGGHWEVRVMDGTRLSD
jgi:competence protein ComEC